MIVWRVMSRDEWRDLITNREYALMRDHKGRQVRYKWFAIDERYIATIVGRRMYKNRIVSNAYNFVVKMEIRGSWIKKKELGFVNVGLDVDKPFELVRIIEVMDVDGWWNVRGKFILPVIGYYWTSKGKKKRIIGTRELMNILRNGNMKKNPWFIRADKYWLFEMEVDSSVV